MTKRQNPISDSRANYREILSHLVDEKSKFRNPDDYPLAIDALFENIESIEDLSEKTSGLILTRKLLIKIIDWRISHHLRNSNPSSSR